IHQDEPTKTTALRRAMQGAINWIDRAPAYGQGQSEQAVGWLVKEGDTKPYLSTKVVLDTDKLADIPGQVERRFNESLTRLNRESVDLLLLHNQIEVKPKSGSVTPDDVLRANGAADALER